VDLGIGRTLFARALDVFRQNALSAALHLPGDGQQRLQLAGNRGLLEIALHLCNQRLITVKVTRRDRPMAILAVRTIVPRRYVGGNQLPFPRR